MLKEPVAVLLKLDESKLGAQVFQRISARSGLIRERNIKREEALENFGKPGRDPHELGGVLSGFLNESGWIPHMQMASLRSDWGSIVGPAIAEHSYVQGLYDGVLTIRADSPSWTTQLQFLNPQILQKVRKQLTGLTINELRITGPQSHGPGMRKRLYVQHNMRPPKQQ